MTKQAKKKPEQLLLLELRLRFGRFIKRDNIKRNKNGQVGGAEAEAEAETLPMKRHPWPLDYPSLRLTVTWFLGILSSNRDSPAGHRRTVTRTRWKRGCPSRMARRVGTERPAEAPSLRVQCPSLPRQRLRRRATAAVT